MSASGVLQADHLSARYPGQITPALHDVSLTLAAGDRLLLLGPNGAGKSTFIRIFSGLMRPSAGAALILGHTAKSMRQHVGVVSHTTFLYEELSAVENLRLFGELYGVPNARTRAPELLQQVALGHLADERVGRMSRGQQQRVTIARALLHDPAVLLLDEPDTGLDLAAFSLLEQLVAGAQHSVVLTTHNLAAGLRLGTRAAILSRGQVVHQVERLTASHESELRDLLQELATS